MVKAPVKGEEMTLTPECSHPRFDSLLGSKYSYFYTQEVLADEKQLEMKILHEVKSKNLKEYQT